MAGYQASDADGGIEQKNAKEQRSEEANDGKQCHTDVVRDADQGKSSIGNTGNLCPEIGRKVRLRCSMRRKPAFWREYDPLPIPEGRWSDTLRR